MNLAVLIYQFVTSKPAGIPNAWPAEVRELGAGVALPGTDWVLMTAPELAALKLALQGQYDVWEAGFLEAQRRSRIFKLTGSTASPIDIDFNIFGLHKEELFTGGWLTTVNLYKNFDPVTQSFSDLVVKDECQYFTAELGEFVTRRIETVTWYMQDGSVGLTKQFTKFYSIEKAFREIAARRGNCVAAAKKVGLYLITGFYVPGLPNAEHFLMICETSGNIRLYEQGITQPLKDFINACTETYLTAGIKAAIVGALS